VYLGIGFSAAFFGLIGTTEPLAAISPVQSCAPRITSGAFSAPTVFNWSRMSPNCFRTTSTATPRVRAHAFATLLTAVSRSASVQILTEIVAADRCGAAELTGRASPAVRLLTFIREPP
jgi:hypothetical protein